jgi:hypothetical protein
MISSDLKQFYVNIVTKYLATTLTCVIEKPKQTNKCILCDTKQWLKYSYTCNDCNQSFCCIHYSKHLIYNRIGNTLPMNINCISSSIFIQENNYGISTQQFANIVKYTKNKIANIHIAEGGSDYLLNSAIIIAKIMPYLYKLGFVVIRIKRLPVQRTGNKTNN